MAAILLALAIAAGSASQPPHVHADLAHDAELLGAAIVKRCRTASAAQPPTSDMPTPGDRERLRGCDSVALYYGIGVAQDARKARLCAFLEMDERREPVLGAAQLLVSIYANGDGTARYPELARRYACSSYFASAELKNLLTHIDAIESNPSAAPALVYCDEITSGFMAAACSALEARTTAPGRALHTEPADGAATPEIADKSRALHAAVAKYAEAHARNEVDLSGTARGVLVTEARAAIEAEAAAVMESLRRGPFPERVDAAAFSLAERDMADAYRALSHHGLPDTTITGSGVRTAQKAFLAYRQAWLDYARVAFPPIDVRSLTTSLTRARTSRLKQLSLGEQ